MKLTGKITDIGFGYFNKKPIVTLSVNESQTFKDNIDTLMKLDKLNIEIKQYREQRSLDANAYYWSLMNQLVEKLQISREELHFKFIKDYSPVMLVPLLPSQNPDGYFKYYEEYKNTEIDGKEAIYYKVYKPSSEMDSKEFWVLIKGLESECIPQGIETLEERKLRQLLDNWDKEKK